jgi:hypothetical protein
VPKKAPFDEEPHTGIRLLPSINLASLAGMTVSAKTKFASYDVGAPDCEYASNSDPTPHWRWPNAAASLAAPPRRTALLLQFQSLKLDLLLIELVLQRAQLQIALRR